MTANFLKFTSRRFLLSWMEQLFRLCANAAIFAWMLIGKNIYGMIKLWSSLKKPPRSYKELKQKQKAKISDYMYLETQNFFQTNGRMPDTDEDCETVVQKVFNHVSGLRVPAEEIHAVYLRKRPHIIERLTISGMPWHIRSHEEIKELQRIRAERKAHTKRRKKRAKKEPKLPLREQNDTFFFIAGYTSGGVPYGLTWEEMGLEPWEDIE